MKLKILFFVSLLCLTLVGPGYAKRRRTPPKPAKQEQPASAQPAAPPPTLAEMPASAPQVAFHSGELTISAQNSTLGDILKEVRAQTGATVELPGNAPERVVGHFGPGPARDVLTSLLNGSHFNYLLLGSAADPNALDRVILMAKSSASNETSPPPMEQANTFSQPVYNRATPMAAPGATTMVVEGQDGQDDNPTDDSADAADEAQTDDQTDDSATDDQNADDQTNADQQVGEDAQQQVQGQQGVKTPEQLLQELQQQQQQLQQQQQNGQPGMPPGFPRPGMPGQPGMPGPPHN